VGRGATPTGPALVIGGASGIGAALVAAYRERDVPVMVWDIVDGCDITCDIADVDQIDEAMTATIEEVGVPVRVSVCAGIGDSGLLLDADPDAFDRIMAVNAKGAWLAMRAAARALIEAERSGSIVALSSVSGRLVDRNTGVYCASKAALDMLVRVAAFEWAASAIRVNAVAPGVTHTPLLGPYSKPGEGWLAPIESRTPLGRIGEPDEVADAVLAVHDLEWVTGQVLACDGGLSLYSPIDSYGYQLEHRPR
jgi:NAD(P)-dependent dehydrogenase (short-subunit alcohol dehydrogenase family)